MTEEAPKWRYAVIDKSSLDWLVSRAIDRDLEHGSQPALNRGSRLFGARCTAEQWRQLKLGVDVIYERS